MGYQGTGKSGEGTQCDDTKKIVWVGHLILPRYRKFNTVTPSPD